MSVGRTIFSAEFARIRPFLFAGLALGLAGPMLATLALEFTRGQGLSPPFGYELASSLGSRAWGDLLAFATLAFAVLLTTGAFPRQRDAGTDSFLAALPVRSGHVFAARALACASVLGATVLSRHVFFLFRHALFGDWAPGFFLNLALPLFLLDLFSSTVALSVALAVAHWRRLGVILLGVVVLVLRLAVDHGGLPRECDLLGVAAPGIVNAEVLLPSAAGVLGWLLGAAFATWWGFSLFRDPKDPLGGIERILHQGVALPRVANGSLALLVVVLPAVFLVPEVDAGPKLIRYPSQRVTSLTGQYRFSFLARDADRFRSLVDSADEIYAGVAGELGVSVSPSEPIEVELAPELRGVDPDWYAFRLALLTGERLLDEQTKGRLRTWGSAGRVLREGVSRNVALKVSGHDAFGSRFHTAILHSRQPLTLDDVFDSEELLRERGPEVAAPGGDVFVDALRDVHGEGALAALLLAVRSLPARPAPRSVEESYELWRDLGEVAGLDSAKLDERLLEIIEDAVYGDARAQISLPRLDVVIEASGMPAGRRVLAVPDQDLPDGWSIVCRVRRASPGARGLSRPRAQSLGADGNGCHVFFVRSGPFDNPPWIQLGLRAVDALPTLETIWENWTAPNGAP